MPRASRSLSFFGATPIFGRAEYARAVGRRPQDRLVTGMLAHHLRAGNIRRISRGVFASASTGSPDRFLAASRLRDGGVMAYRSALELHGCALTQSGEVQVIAPGEPGVVSMKDFCCRFVSPPGRLPLAEGVTRLERHGLTIEVTTLERTVVDLLDRYGLAGGVQELFGSLDLVADRAGGLDLEIDIDAMVRFAAKLGNAAAAGVLGYWLECERSTLEVPDSALQQLRALAPRQSRYALGAKPGQGRAATGWNVILPNDVVERYFDS